MTEVKKEYSREKELEKLLREALPFLQTRGTYYYGTERKGPAAKLVNKIENVLGAK